MTCISLATGHEEEMGGDAGMRPAVPQHRLGQQEPHGWEGGWRSHLPPSLRGAQ